MITLARVRAAGAGPEGARRIQKTLFVIGSTNSSHSSFERPLERCPPKTAAWNQLPVFPGGVRAPASEPIACSVRASGPAGLPAASGEMLHVGTPPGKDRTYTFASVIAPPVP